MEQNLTDLSGVPGPDLTEAEGACGAVDLAASRRQLLSDGAALDAARLRQAWLELHEAWLVAKAVEIGITDTSGFAIVGVGGLGLSLIHI